MTNRFHLTRRSVLAGAAAGVATLAMPSIVRAQDRSLKIGVYGGYFKEFVRREHLPRLHRGDRDRRRERRRAHRRGVAGPVAAGRPRTAGAGGRFDDVPGVDAQGDRRRPLGQARPVQDREPRRRARSLRAEVRRRRAGGRGRGGLVHHPRHQHGHLSRAAGKLGGAVGSGERTEARPPGAGLQLVPARGDGDHLLRRHRYSLHRRGHPQGDGQARRGEAERAALVPRRSAVRAGAEVGRNPDGPVLSRRHGPRRGGRLPRALHLPQGGRHLGLGLLGRDQGVREAATWRTSSSTT